MSSHLSRAPQFEIEDEITPQPLEVRNRTLLTPLGAAEVSASVFCPRRERSVSIDACSSCGEAAGVLLGRRGQLKQLLCRVTPPAEIAPVRGAPGRDEELVERLAGDIGALMSRDVICVSRETSQEQLRGLLLEQGLVGVPVVDAAGRPLGMATHTDLLRAAAEERSGPAGSIMTDTAIAVHESMSIAQAAALMAYEGVHLLPVVDDDWQVVGVISALDVLHWLGQRSGYLMRDVAPHHRE